MEVLDPFEKLLSLYVNPTYSYHTPKGPPEGLSGPDLYRNWGCQIMLGVTLELDSQSEERNQVDLGTLRYYLSEKAGLEEERANRFPPPPVPRQVGWGEVNPEWVVQLHQLPLMEAAEEAPVDLDPVLAMHQDHMRWVGLGRAAVDNVMNQPAEEVAQEQEMRMDLREAGRRLLRHGDDLQARAQQGQEAREQAIRAFEDFRRERG